MSTPHAIGIDVGGTKILAGLVDLATGTVSRLARKPTNIPRPGSAILDDVRQLALEVADGEKYPVGVGLCELVDQGRAIDTCRVDWRDQNVPAALREIGPAFLESDVRAAALAESRFGAGRSAHCFLYISAGTGISHTLVIDGVPYAGTRGRALILGAPQVEHIASGPALAAAAGLGSAEEALNAPLAEHALDTAATALGDAIAFLVHALDPERVVLGGGIGLNPRYSRSVAAAMMRRVELPDPPPLLAAQTGVEAGVLGAALYAAAA